MGGVRWPVPGSWRRLQRVLLRRYLYYTLYRYLKVLKVLFVNREPPAMLSRKSISLVICISDRFKNLCCLEGMCKLDGKCLSLVEEGKKVR